MLLLTFISFIHLARAESVLPAANCNDSYGAICSETLANNSKQKLEIRMKNLTVEARKKALAELGVTEPSEALRSLSAQQGITLRSDLTKEQLSGLFSLEFNSYKMDWNKRPKARDYFLAADVCEKSRTELSANSGKLQTDPVEIQKAIDTHSRSLRLANETLIKIFSTEIPALYDALAKACATIQYSPPSKELLPLAQALCSPESLGKLRSEFAQAYRQSENPELSRRFVGEKVALLKRVWAFTAYTPPAQPVDPAIDPALAKAKQRLLSLQKNLSFQLCDLVATAQTEGFVRIQEQLLLNIERTKTAHDYLINSVYTAERKEVIQQMVDFTKQNIPIQLERAYGGSASFDNLLPKIKHQMNNVQFVWPEPLPASAYAMEPGYPIPVLDLERVSPIDRFWSALIGSKLTSFEEFNAFYSSEISFGNFKINEMFTILPGFVEAFAASPKGLIEVIGHELSHKIGWSVSRINGHDLRSEHRSAVECLARPESIRLIRNQQEDEALADLFGALVVSDYVETQPIEDRKGILMSIATSYCIFGTDFSGSSLRAVHPNPLFRLEGILLARPKVREVLGCTSETPSRYLRCSPGKLEE